MYLTAQIQKKKKILPTHPIFSTFLVTILFTFLVTNIQYSNLYSNVLYKYTIKIKRMWSDG